MYYHNGMDDFVGLLDLNAGPMGFLGATCKERDKDIKGLQKLIKAQARPLKAADKLMAKVCRSEYDSKGTPREIYCVPLGTKNRLLAESATWQAQIDALRATPCTDPRLEKIEQQRVLAAAKAQTKAEKQAAALALKQEKQRVALAMKAEKQGSALALKQEKALATSETKEMAAARTSCKRAKGIFQVVSTHPPQYECLPGYSSMEVPGGYVGPAFDAGPVTIGPDGQPIGPIYPGGTVQPGAYPAGTTVVDTSLPPGVGQPFPGVGAPGGLPFPGGGGGGFSTAAGGAPIDPATGQPIPAAGFDAATGLPSEMTIPEEGGMGKWGWVALGVGALALLYFAKKRKK